jgi:hypothetical protein
MEEAFFTIEEAAGLLECDPSTVYRLITEGWLSRPNGGTRKERKGKVTKKSLFQYVIIDRVSQYPKRILKAVRKGRKKFGEIFSQNAETDCLSKIEERGDAPRPDDPSPNPLPQGEGENNGSEPQRCLYYDFAIQRQFSFGWMARQLAPDDPAMQDDLVQEMSLAVLEYDKPASAEFMNALASNRAKNYIKYEAMRGMVSLSEARAVTEATAEKIVSLNAFIETLLKRGVPVEWIEEVLDRRLGVV